MRAQVLAANMGRSASSAVRAANPAGRRIRGKARTEHTVNASFRNYGPLSIEKEGYIREIRIGRLQFNRWRWVTVIGIARKGGEAGTGSDPIAISLNYTRPLGYTNRKLYLICLTTNLRITLRKATR